VTLRILVVDDSPHVRRALRELLQLRGFAVAGAVGDGDQADVAVAADCPDGVLVDVNLPGRNGFMVAATLASACPQARIVLTSSEMDTVPRPLLEECGAIAFVPKTGLAAVDLARLFGGDPSQARR
jgi:DNA-binding NarL/FixJ family response regulator